METLGSRSGCGGPGAKGCEVGQSVEREAEEWRHFYPLWASKMRKDSLPSLLWNLQEHPQPHAL